MKKIYCIPSALAALCLLGAGGCAKNTDYWDYVSEKRYDIYLYGGDAAEIVIYCSEKESPYVADGIKGNTNPLIEIYATLDGDYESVSVSSESFSGGEMSYLTVRGSWYLSFSGSDLGGEQIAICLEADGMQTEYTLLSVATGDVMSCEKALECVEEHAQSLFENLTENGIFNGEIFIRLLYDENCYYYVGVCDRDGKISAFLVDALSGRIVAEREHRM